jgi:uncharacterized membrane protein
MSHLRLRLIRLWHELLGSLGPIPLACQLGGITLALTTIAIDRRFDYRLVPAGLTGGPAAAETVLGTFATSLVTLTGLVLSLTLVAVQLAMGQFSPRIVRTLLQDRPSQLAIGLFGATFVQAILTLREVHDETAGGPGMVPGLSVMVAYLLMLASLVGLILCVHHPTTTVQAIDRLHECPRRLATRPIPSGRHTIGWDGYVRLAFDELRLAGAAAPQVTPPAGGGARGHHYGRPARPAPGLDRQLELLEAAVRRQYEDEEDVRAALTPDQQGIGSGPDLSAVDHRTEASQQPPATRRTIT